MKSRVPLLSLRYLMLQSVLSAALIAVLLGAMSWALPHLRQSRDALQRQTQQAAVVPDVTFQERSLAATVAAHAHDVARIQSYLPTQDALPNVIAVLEETAVGRQVHIQVPDISAVEEVDENGEPVASPGPYHTVRLTVHGTGQPEGLLQFLHDLEHMPYVLTVAEWQLQAAAPTAVSALSVRAPTALTASGTPEPVPTSQMTAMLLLTVRDPS